MSEKPFYGAECPSYPNCNGGCGLGCTHEIENTLSKYLYTGEPGQHEAIKAAASELAKSVAAQSAVLTHGPIQRRSLHLIQQLAWYYDVNDCLDRPNGAALKVPVVDLCEAKRIALALGLPTGPGYGGAAQAPGNGAVEADEKWYNDHGNGTVSLDAYAGWPREKLKQRCRELCMSVDEWQFIAMHAARDGSNSIEQVREPARSKIARMIAAYSDDDEAAPLPATQGDGE